MRLSRLLTIALALILVGLMLVVAGAMTSGALGGCFFWPFPVIIFCGASSGGTVFLGFILGALLVVAFSVFSLLWMRRGLESSPPT